VDRYLEQLQQQIAAAIDGMSAEQLSRHPAGKWCAVEVLEHLYLTYTGTLKGFQRVSEAGKPLTTAQTWKQRGRTLIVVVLGHMPLRPGSAFGIPSARIAARESAGRDWAKNR
jgi:hypothetical protein